jgi:hypothetical protein
MFSPTSELKDAIQALYQAFADTPSPKSLSVCTNCCMDVAVEKEMCKLPLNRLEAKHFYEYNNAAEGFSTVEEMSYFAPRMLELLALGQSLHHSIEIALQRFKPMQLLLTGGVKKQALAQFALAYFSARLKSDPLEAEYCIADILLMFHLGGFDMQSLLNHWLAQDTHVATLHFATMDYWTQGSFGNAFCSKNDKFHEQMQGWILAPQTRSIFAERLLSVVDANVPNLNQTINWGWTVKDNVEFAFQKCA